MCVYALVCVCVEWGSGCASKNACVYVFVCACEDVCACGLMNCARSQMCGSSGDRTCVRV